MREARSCFWSLWSKTKRSQKQTTRTSTGGRTIQRESCKKGRRAHATTATVKHTHSHALASAQKNGRPGPHRSKAARSTQRSSRGSGGKRAVPAGMQTPPPAAPPLTVVRSRSSYTLQPFSLEEKIVKGEKHWTPPRKTTLAPRGAYRRKKGANAASSANAAARRQQKGRGAGDVVCIRPTAHARRRALRSKQTTRVVRRLLLGGGSEKKGTPCKGSE